MRAGILHKGFFQAPVCRPLLLAALIFPALAPNTRAAEHWIRLKTSHFEMYTTNGEKQGAAELKIFEQVRYFFLQSSPAKTAPDAQVRIIAFRSEKEYKPYRLIESAPAYYLRSRKVDYIVMQDISAEHYQTAVHEYTHLVVEHLGLKLPVWLNEGIADLYSSLEPKGNQAVIGRPLEGRQMILLTQRWLDLNTLFAVGPESPYYNEGDKRSIFYAESWSLTHMLELGKPYMSDFPKFLAAMAADHSAADCFQSVYGKSLAQVTKDLEAYVHQSSVQGAVFDVKLPKSDLEPDISEPSELDVDLVFADLLASQKKTSTEAAQRLLKLAQDYPQNPDVQESLGYLAWQQGDLHKARESFKLAIDRGSKNPEMLFHYSQLLHASQASPDEILPVLQRAVALKPDYQDAWFDLGLTATNARKWSTALDAFSHLKSVNSDRAYALFSAQAYCYLQLKAPDQARPLAEKAKHYAKGPDQELQASNLLRYLDDLKQQEKIPQQPDLAASPLPDAQTLEPERPRLVRNAHRDLPRDVPSVAWPGDLHHVEAVAKFFECDSKNPRLRVIVNSKEMVFEFDDPKAVVVRNANKASIDMHCGPQQPLKIGIFYVPSHAATPVDGIIRELVF